MCGIFFCVFKDGQCCRERIEHLVQTVEPLIRRRGPDNFSTEEKILSDHESGQTCKLILKGAVLHLRGSLTSQPLEDDEGNMLIWNGEVFDGLHIPEDSNDTSVLARLLGNHSYSPNHILNVMSHIQGPWSFVYYQPIEGKLWFGRDYFGRRSLVWHLPRDDNDVMAVSSVAQRSDDHSHKSLTWEEVPAHGIYCLETKPQDASQNKHVETFNFNSFKLKKYPWTFDCTNLDSHDEFYTMKAPVKPFNKDLPYESDLEFLDNEYTNGLRGKAECSLLLTGQPDINKTQILEREAPLVHDSDSDKQDIKTTSSNSRYSKHEYDLELGQEAKDQGKDASSTPVPNNKPFQQTSGATLYNIDTLKELCNKVVISASNSQELTAVCKDGGSSALVVDISHHQAKQRSSDNLPETLISVLGEAVRKRVFNLPRMNPNSEKQKLGCDGHGLGSTQTKLTCEKGEGAQGTSEESRAKNKLVDARVGVLFSGGIDSIVLAALADRFVPMTEAIDLINVAFERKIPKQNPTNKRKPKLNQPEEERGPSFDVPDRLTGRKGVLELNAINPQRQWNFIEVNINLKDLQEARSKHITHLVSPLTSVLDDSIGCALWFAARGSGVLCCPRCIMGTAEDSRCFHPKEYTSLAKVLLVGMGADEQLGGYARHRSKFNQQGWQGLVDEMEMEVNRISERNLGRDDRCISDHGREARFPFLDEQVVSFLSGLPVWLKADLRLPRGTGEKILLRQAAKLLGLTSSAVLPKRAIQFGSRIAKLEGTSEKGSDTCSRLKLN